MSLQLNALEESFVDTGRTLIRNTLLMQGEDLLVSQRADEACQRAVERCMSSFDHSAKKALKFGERFVARVYRLKEEALDVKESAKQKVQQSEELVREPARKAIELEKTADKLNKLVKERKKAERKIRKELSDAEKKRAEALEPLEKFLEGEFIDQDSELLIEARILARQQSLEKPYREANEKIDRLFEKLEKIAKSLSKLEQKRAKAQNKAEAARESVRTLQERVKILKREEIEASRESTKIEGIHMNASIAYDRIKENNEDSLFDESAVHLDNLQDVKVRVASIAEHSSAKEASKKPKLPAHWISTINPKRNWFKYICTLQWILDFIRWVGNKIG